MFNRVHFLPDDWGEREEAESGLGGLVRSLPNSDNFDVPPGETAMDLTNLLISYQPPDESIIYNIPIIALRRHAKLLLKKYSVDIIKRGIVQASHLTDRAFSFAFVERLCHKQSK